MGRKPLPLIVILGPTGSGKTKLSLELASKFGGEMIGADSMQIYKGLDIVTAKATKQEQSQAPHHLIDILEPHETFTVIEYKNRALKIIEDVKKRQRLPIVVGGTNYYIEALLWKILIEDEKYNESPGTLPNNDHELPSEQLHEKLKMLDPSMAKRLHPNNKRKILRSLEVIQQKGKKHSEILDEQHSTKEGSKSDGGLRFPNAIVFWIKCERAILDNRLDARVNSMLEQGLIDELLTFHKMYNERRLANQQPDYTKGIFQSIGFKEFHSYLILDDKAKKSENSSKLLEDGIEELKRATRRYSKKQTRWITNRFLGRTDRKVPSLYGLDTSDPSKWEEEVSEVACDIVQSYLDGQDCQHEPLAKQKNNSVANSEDSTSFCEVCGRVFVGDFQWKLHLKSNRHKRRVESSRKAFIVKQTNFNQNVT